MIKLFINSLMLLEVICLLTLTTTFGSLFLFFEIVLGQWHISPALNFGLPIAVAMLCQSLIGAHGRATRLSQHVTALTCPVVDLLI